MKKSQLRVGQVLFDSNEVGKLKWVLITSIGTNGYTYIKSERSDDFMYYLHPNWFHFSSEGFHSVRFLRKKRRDYKWWKDVL